MKIVTRKLSHKPKKAPALLPPALRSAASESSPVPLGVPHRPPSPRPPTLEHFVYSTSPLALQNEKGEVIRVVEQLFGASSTRWHSYSLLRVHFFVRQLMPSRRAFRLDGTTQRSQQNPYSNRSPVFTVRLFYHSPLYYRQ